MSDDNPIPKKKPRGRPFQKGVNPNPLNIGKNAPTADDKAARKLTRLTVERIFNAHCHSPLQELIAKVKDETLPAIDLLIVRILIEAIKKGDHVKLDFILDRTIGRVPQKTELELDTSKSLHQQIVDIIEIHNKQS